ncbi:hypothetical protein NLI96_g5543 [Meripilus lineatus]|uniref:CAP-Gly domain-containing protein n=1 Tax=Meripilus lineatus TaxID=2056292 RepID=A0AAD5V4W4_9APHY|nr:hypothetical protein NLI96_g5543 [Physisporinus lineatus]
MPPPVITLGAIVDVPAGRGTVRFYGATSFSPGKWVGIELFEADGKNDGTVQGIKYFTCKMSYGIFVKPSQVKLAEPEPTTTVVPPTVRRTTNTRRADAHTLQPTTARPVGHSRTNSVPRVPSNRSIASTRSASPRAASPSKPSSSRSPASQPSPTPSRPSRLGSPTKRTSLTLQPKSAYRSPPQPPEIASPTVTRQRTLDFPQDPRSKTFPSSPKILSPTLAPSQSSPTLIRRRPSPPPEPPQPEPTPEPPVELVSVPEVPVSPSRVQDEQELQELRARIRISDLKRADDQRRIRELETRLQEAEAFVALRPKLQAKLQQQQTDLIAAKRELADAQQLSQRQEERILDSQDQLELVSVDKEVAEERAESAELELEEVKEQMAHMEVELQVLREGGGGEGGNENAIKHSLAYIQLEKQNERLKDALMKLREITQENDQEQRKRIAEMEKDVQDSDDLHIQLEDAFIKLANAETQVEELKLQLDDALGAEELVEQLTERNLMLGEKIEEMRITIEDLEALKALNDEMEEHHLESEKAMQEEMNQRDTEIYEQLRKIQSLEESSQDFETTIVQFRELVLALQSELDTLRAETQTAQHESATAASQNAAMMSLNLKLQSSASKNQARNIDLEVKRIEAREARELLNIVQPYLPQIYVESDMDATNCYLFFQRLALKVDLINTFVAHAHNLPEALTGTVTELLVGVCEMRGRLSNLSTTCKRFAAILRRCDVESFINIGRIYQEMAPMEKRVDMHIDLLRREEFREVECVSDIVKMQSQFDHLSETYFSGFDYDLGERELGYALAFDHDLEMFAASMGLIKTSISAIIQDDDVEVDLGELDSEAEFFGPLQKLLDQCRGAKVLSRKLTKRVEDLTQESGALKSVLIPQLQALNNVVPELVNFGISLAQQVMPHLSDVRSSKVAFHLVTVLDFVKQIAASTVGKGKTDGVSSWGAVSAVITSIMQDAGKLLPLAMENENVVRISGTAPWVLRVDEIKAATAVNVEAERKVAQLNDEIQGLARTIKSKDQHIQEAGVKIELMERRIEAAKKQTETIHDLETEVAKSKKQERAYEEAMEQLQSDLDAFEQENSKLKQAAASAEKKGESVVVPLQDHVVEWFDTATTTGQQPAEPENVAIEGSLETSYLLEQIEALRGTVRFFRSENAYLKSQDLLREIGSLPPLQDPFDREPTPPLVPSHPQDSDSESDDPKPPPNLRTLAAESKLLYRDVIKFTSSPKVVDLSVLRRKRKEESGSVGSGENSRSGTPYQRGWISKKKTPAFQVLERKLEGERLGRRVQGLLERTNALSNRS